MKKCLITLALIGTLLLSPGAALASDITGATFYGIITVTNNSIATTDVFTVFTRDTQDLIDAGFLNATCNNSAMLDTSGTDTAYQPSVNATYPWCVYVPNIGADSALNYLLYTGGPPMDGKIRYFPGSGGMTTPDNATLELSDNFTIEQKGWIDTDYNADKNLVYKPEAFRTWVSATENITSGLFDSYIEGSEWQSPTSGAGASWSDIPKSYDEDTGTYAFDIVGGGAGTWTDWLVLPTTTVNNCEYVRMWHTSSYGAAPSEIQVYYSGGWHSLGAVGAVGAWRTYNVGSNEDISNFQVRFQNDDAIEHYFRVHEVDYNLPEADYDPTVTATGVPSGEHTITTTTDNTSFFLGIGKDIVDADFPIRPSLELNAPLWHDELDGSPFTTKDTNEYAGTVTGAVWGSDGRWFDGGSDLIDFGDILDMGTDNFTIEAWINSNNIATNQTILGKDTATGSDSSKKWYTFQIYSSKLLAQIADGDVGDMGSLLGNTTLTTATWYHCVVTFDRDGDMTLYINSAPDGTADISSVAGNINNTDKLYIGRRTHAGTPRWFHGYISEARIYDRTLTLTEIQQNYNATRWKYETSDEYFHYNLLGTGVTDNTTNWTFLENYSMPYMEYQKIWIDGLLQQEIEWQYATVFTDLSGQNHDATPSFRTATSNADVSAALASFSPISEAKAPAWVLEAVRDFWDPTDIEATGEFTTTPSPTFPGKEVVEAMAAASNTPAQLPFTLITGFIILAFSVTASWFMAKHGSRNLWLKVIVIVTLMAFAIAVDMFDFWMLVFFVIMAIAIILFSRQRAR